MSQDRINDFLQRNQEYAKIHIVPPQLIQGARLARARGSVVVLTCSDPRIIPESFLNFGMGEACVIRNAGGRAMDAERTLQILDTVGNVTAVMIVHHTDCGGLSMTDETVHKRMRERDAEAASELEGKVFGTFRDIGVEESVRQDMAIIRKNAFLSPQLLVKGFVLDLQTGLLTEVS